jgi:23S rRNA-/tRNA-specific pseudouridylate synthase
LDYATSGLLLIAKNQYAANTARICFEHRTIQKQYIAVLLGHVSESNHTIVRNIIMTDTDTTKSNQILQHDQHDDDDDDGSYHHQHHPVISQQMLHDTMKQIEEQYRTTRQKWNNEKKGHTFPGYLPPHALFQQWQRQQQQKHQRNKKQSMTHKQSTITVTSHNSSSSSSSSSTNTITTSLPSSGKTRMQPQTIKMIKLTENEWNIVWNELNEYFEQMDHTNDTNGIYQHCSVPKKEQFLTMRWKEIKNSHPDILHMFEQAATIHNIIFKQRNDLETYHDQNIKHDSCHIAMNGLPTVFQVTDDNDDQFDDDDDDDDDVDGNDINRILLSSTNNNHHRYPTSFYIAAPLAEPLDRNTFSMLIHESYADHRLCPQLLVHSFPTPERTNRTDIIHTNNGDEHNSPINDNKRNTKQRTEDTKKYVDFKPALTKCTILRETYYDAIIVPKKEEQNIDTIQNTNNHHDSQRKRVPVTLVLLEPKTGRRHQLRVHTALIGHPILGDQTYCNHNTYDMSDCNLSRLCLHSYRLTIPLPPVDDTNFYKRNHNKKMKYNKIHDDTTIRWRHVISKVHLSLIMKMNRFKFPCSRESITKQKISTYISRSSIYKKSK